MIKSTDHRFLSKVFWVLLFALLTQPTWGQQKDQDSINRKRLNTVVYTSTGVYVTSLVVLYYGWYKDNPMTSWHFIDDSYYWFQVDKVGHATTAYTISNYGHWMLRWAGLNNKNIFTLRRINGFWRHDRHRDHGWFFRLLTALLPPICWPMPLVAGFP